jgi:5-oxoprolinase (ATP-hydrolysing) subunit A
MELDLNADLGEGAGFDDQLMPLITSANICCGFHAGGPEEIAATLELARQYGVAIGAHPGYNDRGHFGRVELDLPSADITSQVLSQLQIMDSMARACGLAVQYVKPHGALYNQACRDRRYADAIVLAAARFQLPIVGLPGSQLEAACPGFLPFVPEGFADRRYRADGSLVARSEPDAFVHDPEEAVKQIEWLLREKGIRTVCIHGDNPDAVRFAKAVREALLLRGIGTRRFGVGF